MKMFKLCTTDGYTWNFEIYCDKSDTFQHLRKNDSVTVKSMMPLLDIEMTLYTDNFYTSLPLTDYLLVRKTYLCGTVRASRKELPQVKAKPKIREIISLGSNKGIKKSI